MAIHKAIRFKGRIKPYTSIGIRRKKCFRCCKQAKSQWSICANNNYFVPICTHCDILLNKLVLSFMGFHNTKNLIQKYKAKKGE